MNLYNVRKSSRRSLVMIRETACVSAGNTMHSLQVLCETDCYTVVGWVLGWLDDDRARIFARELLNVATLAEDGDVILSKHIPLALYMMRSGQAPAIRNLWDALKEAVSRYPLTPSWDWNAEERAAAADKKSAFAAFKAARKDEA